MFTSSFPATSQAAVRNATQQIDWLRLVRSRRVGPATFRRLMDEYGSAETALEHLPQVARASGVKDYAACPPDHAKRELETGQKLGFTPLFLGTAPYPELLATAPDAPPFLWAVGRTDLLSSPTIAIVGARNASSLGARTARMIAKDLGEAGITIVSGLARGVDAVAHTATLDSGTIAVQAGGLDVVYPKENTKLFDQIAQSGLRLSEQPLGLTPQARHFPQRNRIISGLSLGVVVIEGAARSGSLITARHAADLGREVMAVPGNPLDGRAGGCNILIRDGATLIRSGADVIDAVGHLLRPEAEQISASTPNPSPVEPDTNKVAARILDLLGPAAVSEDTIIRDSGLPAREISKQILALELSGRIERHAGGMLARIN